MHNAEQTYLLAIVLDDLDVGGYFVRLCHILFYNSLLFIGGLLIRCHLRFPGQGVWQHMRQGYSHRRKD